MSLSAGQLSLIRSQEQHSSLGLAILNPQTVLACQINQTFSNRDMITELTYDNVTEGSYSNVLSGMTAFVGTTPGAHDLGYCRIRKAPTSSKLYVGEVSELKFLNDRYITVVDAFEPWPKHLVVTSDEVFMDVDVDYSDQHENFDPIPALGGNVVVDVSSYPVTVRFPEVANSTVFDSTISSYSFSASEGTVFNETTTNPGLTISSYPTNGYIRVTLLLTAATGKTQRAYAYVFVFDPTHRPITDFTLNSCGADHESGGWQANVTLNNSTDIGTARFRGLAVLFSKDYFNGSENTSVGLYPGRENIWFSGWVYEHTSVNDPAFEPRTFDIQGAHFWLGRMPSFPVGVELSTSAATVWTEMEGLTVDKGLYHFLRWRTTLMSILDVYLTDDTRYSPAVESPAGNLWGQIADIASVQISAIATCDHNNKLVVKVPYNLLPSADRAAASTKVMDLTTVDYERGAEVYARSPQVAQVVLSGVSVDEFGNHVAIFSLAPGHVPALLGELLPVTNQLLEDQTQANEFAGLIFAKENNPYPEIPLTLNANNRAFDIAPVLYADITGLDEYTGTLLPYAIDYTFNHDTGKNVIDIIFEGETDENDAIYINGDIPDGEGGFIPIPGLANLPPLEPIDLPDIPTFPTTPGTTDTPCSSGLNNYYSLVWSKYYLDGTDSNKLVSNANFSCKLRGGIYGPSYLIISIHSHGDAYNLPDVNVAVYGMLGGSKVATGTIEVFGSSAYQLYVTFNLASDTLVDGFQIELDAGVGSYIESYTTGSVIASGSVAATSESGAVISGLTVGTYMWVKNSGGPWDNGLGNLTYNYRVRNAANTADLTILYALADGNYFERIHEVIETSCRFRVKDDPGTYGDNSGTLGYTFRNVTVVGRALDIYGATLYNVCAP